MLNQEIFFSELETLKSENQGLRLQIKSDQEKIKYYTEEVERLIDQLNGLKRSNYGKKSERYESQEQMVFNEAEVLTQNLKPELSDEIIIDGKGNAVNRAAKEKEITVKEHTKKVRGHRKPLPKELTREVVKLELPESEQISADGVTPLKIIGYEVSEKLVYEPAVVKVLEIHCAKYGVEAGDYEKTAPHVPARLSRRSLRHRSLQKNMPTEYLFIAKRLYF